MTFTFYPKGAGVAFTEVDVTANPAAFESVTDERGHSRVPVAICNREDAEGQWSGLNSAGITWGVGFEVRIPECAFA